MMLLDRLIAVRNTKTVYRDGDKCLKVFHQEHSKADVLNEALNQARIETTGLSVPKVLEVTVIDGKWTIVSEYIKGKTLEQMMQESPEKRDESLKLFVDLQLTVLSKTCPMLSDLQAKMHREIEESKLDAAVRHELHARLNSMPHHHKVCHGDFNPSNIIIAEDGTPYLLDWSHVTQGNASADAARTYLLFRLNGDMEGAEKYLDLFCRKAGAARQYVEKWIPIVAASQLVKGNAKEREGLLSWVDAADHE